MSDRLDELERLNGLRERGTLDEAEYARAKANVLGADEQKRRLPSWVAPAGAAGGIALALFVIKPLLRDTPAAEVSGNEATSVAEAAPAQVDDSWSVSFAQDPMTDLQVTTAVTKLIGRAADIELVVSCSSNGVIKYQLMSFDKAGDPVEMRSYPDKQFKPYAMYHVRIGNAASIRLTAYDMQYNNVIVTNTGTPESLDMLAQIGAIMWPADEMAKAARLTLAIPLVSSEETVIVDQTSASFINALKPCVAIRSAQIAKYQKQAGAGQREQSAREAGEPDQPQSGAADAQKPAPLKLPN